ncbi:MAG TPA: site-specific integrase [Bacteriovoracaceae bacterium]|nr:site-specific integrase [Bacteriovoracaceae bacterium]
MAIIEYEKNGKKVFKVYVQFRGKTIKRLRVQKVVYNIESLAVARREERRIIKELAEKLAKLEGKGLLWSEILFRWENAAYCGHLGKKLNRFTIADHVNRLRKYTAPWLGLIASDLNKADGRRILSYAESLGVKGGLLNKIKSSINLVYNWGSEEGLISGTNLSGKSPVYGLGFEGNEEKMKPILTLAEVRKFLLEAKIQKHPWYPIWAFAVLTGMRSGELMALEWGDIDEQNGIIRVSKSFNKRMKVNKCPKNGTWRNVDINSQLAGLVRSLRHERRNETHVLPNFSEWKNGQAGVVLRLFLERIGINKPVVFHALRACFATHLLSTGVEPLRVMRMGGWSDLKTFQIYLRLSGVDVKGVAEGLDVLPDRSILDKVLPLHR